MIATIAWAPPLHAEPSAQLNRFSPGEQNRDGFATRSAETQGHLRFGAQIYLDYANDPLEFSQDQGGETVGMRVIQRQLTGHLHLSLGIQDWLTLFMGAPVVLRQTGEEIPGRLRPGVVDGDGSSPVGLPLYLAEGAGLGDVFLGGRAKLYGTPEDIFMLAASARIGLPTATLADENQHYRGEPTVSAWPELIGQVNAGRLRVLLNVGVLFRDQTASCDSLDPPGRGAGSNCFPGIDVGHELTYAAGGSVDLLGDDALMGIVELVGRTNVRGPFEGNDPLELLAGLKYFAPAGLMLGLGGGPGIIQGFGSPDYRVFGTLGYTSPAKSQDPDGDGLAGERDACPTDAEDMDGFQDADGCPDPDNDGDGVADASDQCPAEAEDADGFEDADGCPDTDNDADGVPDAQDQCRDEAEDVDGFEDADGCPDLDNDGDGLADTEDRCPSEAGPTDNGGCPVADRDGDGIADGDDECPDEAGTAEYDGCPAPQVKVESERLVLDDKVYFDTGSSTIQARSFKLLDSVAKALNDHPNVEAVRVEGHTDSRGSRAYNTKLSQARAEAVMQYLVEHGVDAGRLRAKGFGPRQPIVKNAQNETDHARNRRVDFVVLQGAEAK